MNPLYDSSHHYLHYFVKLMPEIHFYVLHTFPVFSFQFSSRAYTLREKLSVQVSAGIDLIFFLADGMALGFGFLLKIVVITHQCFSFCRVVLTLSKDLSFSQCLPVRRLGVHKKLGGDRTRTASSDTNKSKGYCHDEQ